MKWKTATAKKTESKSETQSSTAVCLIHKMECNFPARCMLCRLCWREREKKASLEKFVICSRIVETHDVPRMHNCTIHFNGMSLVCLPHAFQKKRLSKAKTLQPFWDGLFVELLLRVSIERAIHFNWCRMWMKWLFWIQKISNTFKSNTNVVRRICACRGSNGSSTILVECKIWLRCCLWCCCCRRRQWSTG